MFDIEQVYAKFPTEADCTAYLERVRWQGQASCPYCGSGRVSSVPKQLRHHCNGCFTAFSVKVATIFHHTRMPLQKWFLAISLAINTSDPLTARQLSERLGVHKNTAWYVVERIRSALADPGRRSLLERIAEDTR